MIHTAPFITAALAHLQLETTVGLPAALARQNVLYDAALAVERPVKYTDGTEDVLASPWVEVAAPQWRISNFSLGQLVADLDITVVVRGYMEDPVAGRLNKRLQILGAALLDSLVQPKAFGDGVIRDVTGNYPINPASGEREYYRGAATLLFSLEVGEARTPL